MPLATLLVVMVAVLRRGHTVLALVAGLLLGVAAGRSDLGRCEHVWRAGAHAAWVVIHDSAGEQGVTTANVVRAPEGCDGTVRLALPDSIRPPGGSLALVAGFFRPTILRVKRIRVVREGQSLRYVLRDRLTRRIAVLYGSRAGTVSAMVLGRRDEVSPELRRDFVASGLAHLLAISGLHVGIVAGWIFLICNVLGVGGRRDWLVVAGVWAYVALLAFPAPATRAAAFVSVGTLARRVQRAPPPEVFLSLAAVFVFTLDPRAITSVGAWLSLSAVWGTSLAGRELRRFGISSPVWRLVAGSVGATLATAPITAFAFGSIAPVGIAANLLAVPLVGVLVPGILLSLPFGSIMAAGAGALLWCLEWIARVGAGIPGGHLQGQGWEFGACTTAVTFIVLRSIRRRPTWSRLRLRVIAGLALLSWGTVALSTGIDRDRRTGLTVYVLDVGQGDAIAIRTPGNRWILIDGGPRFGSHDAGTRVVIPFLTRMGVRRLELLVLSHGDSDHLGGVPAVVDAFPIGQVLEPGQPLESGLYQEFLGALISRSTPWEAGRAGDRITLDSVELTVIHPTADWADRELNPNENSLVILLRYRGFSMLLTGDAEAPAEDVFAPLVPQIDVLKVGHHGSATSSSEVLLDRGDPRVAVVSVGSGNSYGHPAAAVLAALAGHGADTYRTDIGGTVTIWSNGEYFDIRQEIPTTFISRLSCLLRISSRSNGSYSRRSGCTSTPRVTSRRYSTTSHWPERSSPGM